MEVAVISTQHSCLSNLFSELDEVSYSRYVDAAKNRETFEGVVIQTPEKQFGLLDSFDKLESVVNYARELGVRLLISTDDARVSSWARELGLAVTREYTRSETFRMLAC
jgi:predicted DNA-binding protein (UPF0278 family)